MNRRVCHKFLFSILLFNFFFIVSAQADTMREVVHYALKTNPRLLASESVRLATDQQLAAAQANYLPTLDVTAGYGREGSRNSTTTASQPLTPNRYINLGRRESNIHLNQNLFRGFFDENNVLRSRHRLRSSAYSVQQEVQNVALSAVEKYLEVLRISIVERLAQRNLEVHDRIFKMIKKRSEQGLSHKADLEQAKGRMASAKARLVAEQGRLKDAQTEYVRVVGRAPLSLAAPSPLPKGALPSSEEIAVELAEKRNPALKVARAEVDAAVSRFKSSHSSNYPTFDFELSAKSNYNVDGVRGNDKDYAAMFRMNYNLFNGGGDLAHQRETAHLVQEAYEIRNRTHREVIENMRLAWNALLTSKLRLDDLKEHKDSAWETVLAYRKQFQLGQRTLLDLLDSENEWFLSSVAYINDKFNEFFAQYRILHSMGYLVQVLRLPMPPEAFVAEDAVTFIGPDSEMPGVPNKPDEAVKGAEYDGKSPADTKEEQQQAVVAKLAKSQASHNNKTSVVKKQKSHTVSKPKHWLFPKRVKEVLVSAFHLDQPSPKAKQRQPLVRFVGNGKDIKSTVEDLSKKGDNTTAASTSAMTQQTVKSSKLSQQFARLWKKKHRTTASNKQAKVSKLKSSTTPRPKVKVGEWLHKHRLWKQAKPTGAQAGTHAKAPQHSRFANAWAVHHQTLLQKSKFEQKPHSGVSARKSTTSVSKTPAVTQYKRHRNANHWGAGKHSAQAAGGAKSTRSEHPSGAGIFAKVKALRERNKKVWRQPNKAAPTQTAEQKPNAESFADIKPIIQSLDGSSKKGMTRLMSSLKAHTKKLFKPKSRLQSKPAPHDQTIAAAEQDVLATERYQPSTKKPLQSHAEDLQDDNLIAVDDATDDIVALA